MSINETEQMNMKQSFLIIGLLLTSFTAQAQVTVPFEVPAPAWLHLVTPVDEKDAPLVYRRPDADSDNLVYLMDSENSKYGWKSSSAPLAEEEAKFTLASWENYPLSGAERDWAHIEIRAGEEVGSAWVLAEKLKIVETHLLTQEELPEGVDVFTWTYGEETYFITSDGEGDGVTSPMTFYVGKLKDGYLVFPYLSVVDSVPSFKSGNKPLDLKKFTSEDVEYVLQHAKSFERGMCLVLYGYDEDGQKKVGSLDTRLVKRAADNDAVCDVPDQIAVYPGNVMGDIIRGVRYPAECRTAGIQGRVMATFIVEKDGSVSNVKIIKGVHPALDREVVRMLYNLKRFSPAKKDGKAVRMRMTVPILFRL